MPILFPGQGASLVLSSLPFVENSTASVTGLGNGGPNYCLGGAPADSTYHLNRTGHNNFVPFTMTIAGVVIPAYCLQLDLDGPIGGQNEPYTSGPPAVLMPTLSQRQRLMLNYIAGNEYPVVTAAAMWAALGVNATAAPPLNDADAYAVVQTAVWLTTGDLNAGEAIFINCADTDPHVKNARLVQAVNVIVAAAGAYADAVIAGQVSASSVIPSAGLCAGSAGTGLFQDCRPIDCCNLDMAPADPAEPYLLIQNCPTDLRCMCGQLILGPFVIESNTTGTPAIAITSACDPLFSFTFVDACGAPIAAPGIGTVFYLALRSSKCSFTINITLTTTATVTQINWMEAADAALQHLLAPLTDVSVIVTSETLSITIRVPFAFEELFPSQPQLPVQPGDFHQSFSARSRGENTNININNNTNSTNANTNLNQQLSNLMGVLSAMGGFGGFHPWFNGQFPQPPFPPQCPPGMSFVPGIGCVPGGEPCPPGTQPGCVPNNGRFCPPGTHYVPGRGCVANNAEPCAPICPPNCGHRPCGPGRCNLCDRD